MGIAAFHLHVGFPTKTMKSGDMKNISGMFKVSTLNMNGDNGL